MGVVRFFECYLSMNEFYYEVTVTQFKAHIIIIVALYYFQEDKRKIGNAIILKY